MSVGHVRAPCKNGLTDRDVVWMGDSGGPMELCIRWGQHRTNPFVGGKGDMSAMRPFAELLQTLVSLNCGLGWVQHLVGRVGL